MNRRKIEEAIELERESKRERGNKEKQKSES